MSESGDQIIVLNLGEKSMKMKCKTCWETGLWISGLRNAVEIEKDFSRTQNGILQYNIGTLYSLFSWKQDNEILKFVNSMTSGLNMGLSASQFANEFKCLSHELVLLADSFYAHKPFVSALFKFIVVALHNQVRTIVKNYWNQFFKIFQASEILQLASVFCLYERTMTSWGIIDYKFIWTQPIQTSFIKRVFENSKTPITNIILEFEKNTFTENGKLHSTCCTALDSHVYFLLSNYQEVPLNSFSEKLCTLIFNVLSSFLIQVINMLIFKDYQTQIYIAILNNSFMKMIKGYEKKIHSDTKSQLSLKVIRELINEKDLIDLLNKIETLALKKLKAIWKKEILSKFKTEETFFEFDLEQNLSSLVSTYENNLKMIILRCHMEALLHEMFDRFLSVYLQKFLAFCEKITAENYKQVSETLQKDYRILQGFFEVHIFATSPEIILKFKQLRVFFDTDDIDECIASILNMTVFTEGLCDFQKILKLMKAKLFFPQNSITYATQFVENAIKVDKYQAKIRSLAFNSVIFNRFFHRVIIKLSLVIRIIQKIGGSKSKSEKHDHESQFKNYAGFSSDKLRAFI